MPKNTDRSTNWALTNFLSWSKRNVAFKHNPGEQVPSDLLVSNDAVEICKWFICYIAETRRRDGSEYPAKTIYLLLTGLLRHMRSRNPKCPNFLEMNDQKFASLHNALDNIFRDLRAKGAGAQSCQTEAFSKENEDILWVLGTDSPKCLLRVVFFLNGKSFCGSEPHELKLSQFKRLTDPHR